MADDKERLNAMILLVRKLVAALYCFPLGGSTADRELSEILRELEALAAKQ